MPFTLAAIAAWGASAGFNAKFGIKMGGSDRSLVVLWVMLFVALDVLKAGGGMKLRQAISTGNLFNIVLAFGLLISGTSFSLLAAFNWRTQAAAEDAAARQQVIEHRKALKIQIESDRARAANLKARDSSKIIAELVSAKRHDRYRTSEQCTNATITASIKLCNRIAALTGERDRASERAFREKRITDNEAKLEKLTMPTKSANPMAASLANLLTLLEIEADPERLGDILMATITILAEFVSVAGPMLLAKDKPRQRRARPLFSPRRKDTPPAITPANGQRLARDEAFSWLARAKEDERVKWDGDSITATNKQLARIFGRPPSTVNDWLNTWSKEGLIEKRAGARGTRIRVYV